MAPHVKITARSFPVTYSVTTADDTFDFAGPFWSPADIIVRKDGVPLAVNEYTVGGNYVQDGQVVVGAYAGGTVTLNLAVSNCTIEIDRFVEAQRDTDYSRTAPLPIDQLNSDLDKLAARDQDLDARLTDLEAGGVPSGGGGGGGGGPSGPVDWSDLTGKPATFPPSAHTHDPSQIPGLSALIQSYLQGDGLYAYNPSDLARSMAHFTAPAVGDTYPVQYFGSNNEPGSSGIWRVIATSGMGTLGTITQVPGTGLVLEGLNARFLRVPDAGDHIDIRSVGVRCDGTLGQDDLLNLVTAAARDMRYCLVGAGIFRAQKTLNFKSVDCDLSFLKIQAGPASTGSGTALSDFFTAGFNGVQTGITTKNIQEWDEATKSTPADTRTLGIVVLAGGASPNGATPRSQKFWVWGDGNSSYSARATCIGVFLQDVETAQYDLQARVSYCHLGVAAGSNLGLTSVRGVEKNTLNIGAKYCEYVFWHMGTGWIDTCIVHIQAERCRHFVWEDYNSDGSPIYDLLCEGQDVPPIVGSPAILIRNGKHGVIRGRIRAISGYRCIYVDKAISGAVAYLHLDLTTIHGYGTVLEIDRLRHLSGRLVINDQQNGPDSSLTYPCPAVWLNRVANAGTFELHITGCFNREGLRLGNTTLGFYPRECNFGIMSISMDSGFPFNSSGVETSGYTNLTAVVIERMKGGSLHLQQIKGHITVLPDVSQGVDISVPSEFYHWKCVKDAAAVANLTIRGGSYLTHYSSVDWLFDNVRVESFVDVEGLGAVYRSSRWNLAGAPAASLVALSSRTSKYNRAFKRIGCLLTNNSDGLSYVARGPGPTDDWQPSDGGTPLTPDYLPQTTDIDTRMQAAGASPMTTAQLDAHDELFVTLIDAGLYDPSNIVASRVKAIWRADSTDNFAASLQNLLFDQAHLSVSGTVTHTPYAQWLGDGATGYLQANIIGTGAFTTLGLAQNDMGGGVWPEGFSQVNSYDVGSNNGRFRIRAHRPDSGAGYAVNAGNNTSGISGGSAPRHVTVIRRDATYQSAYLNGAFQRESAEPSTGLADRYWFFRSDTTYSDLDVSGGELHHGLTAAEIAVLDAAVAKFRKSLRALTVLQPLSLSADDIASGSPDGTAVGSLMGISAGSTVTMTNNSSNRFKLVGTTVFTFTTATDYNSSTSHTITVQETNGSASNSPRSTTITINVTP